MITQIKKFIEDHSDLINNFSIEDFYDKSKKMLINETLRSTLILLMCLRRKHKIYAYIRLDLNNKLRFIQVCLDENYFRPLYILNRNLSKYYPDYEGLVANTILKYLDTSSPDIAELLEKYYIDLKNLIITDVVIGD